jgi:hypothetical protein
LGYDGDDDYGNYDNNNYNNTIGTSKVLTVDLTNNLVVPRGQHSIVQTCSTRSSRTKCCPRRRLKWEKRLLILSPAKPR